MKAVASPRKNLWGCLILALLTAVSYIPAMRGGFIWDDDSYVTANPTLTQPDGLRRIWLEPGATPQYYPAVFSSFRIEHRLWKLRPAGYHVVNVALHIVNANLLWLLLARVGFPLAGTAAALFALHPLQVESVAWIAERKNVLSGCFYLLAAIAYLPLLEFARGGKAGERLRTRNLTLSWMTAFFFFILALLSKSVTATLPVALLVLAWWRRGFLTRKDFLLLTPFLAAGTASGLFTAWLEKNHVGALGANWSFSLDERLVIAGKNIWFYVVKALWPQPLSFVYPRWQPHGYPWWHLAAPGAAVVVVVLLWRFRSRIGRGPLAAALFSLATLAPALGFVDFYPMRYSFVADHFFYLAIIGPILGILGCVAVVTRSLRDPGDAPASRAPSFTRVAAGSLVLLLVALTWRRSVILGDEEKLWRDTLARNPAATSASVNLGILLAKRGAYGEAMALFQSALAAEPGAADILTNLGHVYDSSRRTGDAEVSYRDALRSDPDFVAARVGLGSLLQARGEFREAIRQFSHAAALAPNDRGIGSLLAGAHYNLGKVLDSRGEPTAAIALYREALRINPDFPEAHNNLGVDLAEAGEPTAAATHFRAALKLRPDYREAAVNLETLISRTPK